MERKYVKCKKCGMGGLYWRQSAKGNWYLVEEGSVSTNNYYNNLSIPFAHSKTCIVARAEREERNQI